MIELLIDAEKKGVSTYTLASKLPSPMKEIIELCIDIKEMPLDAMSYSLRDLVERVPNWGRMPEPIGSDFWESLSSDLYIASKRPDIKASIDVINKACIEIYERMEDDDPKNIVEYISREMNISI